MDGPAIILDDDDVTAGSKSLKLAERVARQIGSRIAASGAQAGDFLGTESVLFREFSASRSTIREAIAILETQGTVLVRRGRNGGLFAAPRDAASISYALRGYFEYVGVTVDEIMATRKILNALVIRRAAERATEEHVELLRRPGMRFWTILRATDSPILDVFARSARRFEILGLLRSDVTPPEYFAMLSASYELQHRQAEAILIGDMRQAYDIEEEALAHAGAFMRRCLENAKSLPRDEIVSRLDAMIGPQRPVKKPEKIMYSLMSDILDRGWAIGEHLGSEPEMLERYNVGRSAFREAIRPMEQYGIVEMRTGRRSGLKIKAPTLAGVHEESLLRLVHLNASLESYMETYEVLGAASAALAAERGVAEGAGSADFRTVLGQACGNRVLATMFQLLGAGVETMLGEGTARPADDDASVLAAVRSGDAALAYRAFLAWTRRIGAPHVA